MKSNSKDLRAFAASRETQKEVGKPALTPKLRFPEFQDAPGWAGKPMGEVYSFKGNNSLSRDQLNYEHGSVKNIHYGDIHTKFSTLFDITKEKVPFINPSEQSDGLRPENDCVEGDMILADASEDLEDIGKSIEVVRLNGERVVAGQHTILARPNDDNLVLGFGAYLFKSSRVRTQIQKESQGSKVLGISATRLTKIELPIPSTKSEQGKIASCLASLDALIAAESQKLDALKDHKKGLMRQLFPREGETQPRLRFPEFEDGGEWAEKKLGELFSNRVEKGKDGLPIYSVTMNDGMVKRASLAREFDDIADPEGNKRVHKKDIVYNMMRMWQGALGVAIEGCLVSPAYIVLSPGENVWSDFFAYLFKLPQSLRLLTAHSRGLTKDRLRLYYNDFALIPVLCPEFAEQQRIANCLTSLDDLIASQTQKLDALKTHKKGLMQQLFPSPEGQEE
jgi:type I restriction enzyme S subunit